MSASLHRSVLPSLLGALLGGLVVGGCQPGTRESLPTEGAAEPFTAIGQEEPHAMSGFSWVVDQQLAGMPRPGGHGDLDGDLAFLQDQGIDLLVSLTEAGTDPELASGYGIEVLHLPVADFHAPTLAQLDEFAEATLAAMNDGKRVGVHCAAGLGRTGTFLSAYFVTQRMTADRAIAHVRELRPGSVETEAQVQAVHDFAEAWGKGAAAVPARASQPPAPKP